MLSLLLRNLFFTILQPGIVAGLIPYWLVRDSIHDAFEKPLRSWLFLSILIFIIGFYLMMDCILRFAIKGRGTLSPADPTKKLVISGWYRYSRNPMYVGVLLILLGEAIFFNVESLWSYTIFIVIIFTIFIVFVEEPRLRRDFGEEYTEYCKKVRRWI